ncbi:MAG: hypothetical protein ACYDG2_07780 [Ruminiclostridium sp.]
MELIYIFIAFIVMIPYNILGIDFSNQLIFFVGGLYLLFNHKAIKPNKAFWAMTMVIAFSFLGSLFYTKDFMTCLNGLANYLNIPVYYLIMKSLVSRKEKIFISIYYSTIIVVSLSILIEGILLHKRIQGNFTYANSFALMLLSALFLSNFLPPKTMFRFGNILIIWGIFFTGSRTTIFLMVAFLVVKYIICSKDERFFWDLYDLAGAVILYISSKYFGIFSVILLIAVVMLRSTLDRKKVQIRWLKLAYFSKIIISIVSISICFLSLELFNTNMGSRLVEVSYNSGVLQERFIIFTDAFKHILLNPFGSGINSFEYMQYINQTAFYDVRFVHNSILQTSYDIGVIPMIMFVTLLAYGLIKIIKSNTSGRNLSSILIVFIFLHSLLDFDFSFSTISIVLIMIYAFWGTTPAVVKLPSKKVVSWLGSTCIALGLYLLVCSLTLLASQRFSTKYDYSPAIYLASFNSKITYRNANTQSLLAQYYKQLADSNDNREMVQNYLIECNNHLTEAEKLNPSDVRIKINMALTLSRLGDFKTADNYFVKSIKLQKFNPDLYYLYNDFLKDENPEKVKWLEDYKRQNILLLNPRAVYLPNQLSETKGLK